jgi:hypothetical protein
MMKRASIQCGTAIAAVILLVLAGSRLGGWPILSPLAAKGWEAVGVGSCLEISNGITGSASALHRIQTGIKNRRGSIMWIRGQQGWNQKEKA